MNLCIFQHVLKDEAVDCLLQSKRGNRDAYYEAIQEIIYFYEEESITDNVIKEYIIRLMVEADTVLAMAKGGEDTLKAGVIHDCEALYVELLSCDWDQVSEKLNGFSPKLLVKRRMARNGYERSIEKMVASTDCDTFMPALMEHMAAFGVGILSKYSAYKWGKDYLEGIEEVAPMRFEDLIGLVREKELIISNTDAFIKGLPANNMLLFGSRGTGKSSCVRALLPMYYESGLRLIEMPKQSLRQLPELIDMLKNRKQRFIIFMDDLSFESGDTEYKHLKVLLDGQLEKRPDNVLIYATSNRRHLIKETWSDRNGVGEDIFANDTVNEKLSLAERFGIHILFMTPSQNEYLDIVEGLLSKEGIVMTDLIREEALEWELTYHGRSGRTAQQFVMNYIGEDGK